MLLNVLLDALEFKEIRWYHDSNLVAKTSKDQFFRISPRHNVWENGSLQIAMVERYDTGNYTCEIIRPDPWAPVKQIHAIEVMRK